MKTITLKNINLGEIIGLDAGVINNKDIITIEDVLVFSDDNTFNGKGTMCRLEILNLKNWFMKDDLCEYISNNRLRIATLYNSESNKEELKFLFDGSEFIIEREYYEFRDFTKILIKDVEYKKSTLSKFLIEASNILLASKTLKVYAEFARAYKYLLELKYIFDKEVKFDKSVIFRFTRDNFNIMLKFIRYLESRADIYNMILKVSVGNSHISLNPYRRIIFINDEFIGEETYRDLINTDNVKLLLEKLKEKYLDLKGLVTI